MVYQAGHVAGHTAGRQYVRGLGAGAQPGAQCAAVLHSGQTTASPPQPPALQWLRYVVTSLSPGSWHTLPLDFIPGDSSWLTAVVLAKDGCNKTAAAVNLINYWSLLYSAVLCFRADSLRLHVILHE